MKYFPIFLRLENKPCLVVGGGEIAHRKIELLRRAGATVTVVAPSLCDELVALARSGAIIHQNSKFAEEQVAGNTVIIAATNDKAVNAVVPHSQM